MDIANDNVLKAADLEAINYMDPTTSVVDFVVNIAIDFVEREVCSSIDSVVITNYSEQGVVANYKDCYHFFIEKSNEVNVQEAASDVVKGNFDKEPKGSDKSAVVSGSNALDHVTNLDFRELVELHYVIVEEIYEVRNRKRTVAEDYSPINSINYHIVAKENYSVKEVVVLLVQNLEVLIYLLNDVVDNFAD